MKQNHKISVYDEFIHYKHHALNSKYVRQKNLLPH